MSVPLPDPRPRARRYHWWVLLGVAVVALAVMVAAFFFARRQIGEFFARRLSERLSEDGVFIGWKSSDWVPGGGILMRGMALYRDAAKQDRLALLGVVTAKRGDPSWARWDKVDFKAADTQLVLGSGETETRLDRMEVLLLLRPGQIDLREFHASLQGLRIDLRFALVDKPPAENAEAAAASKKSVRSAGLFRDVNLDWLKLVREWVKIQPENNEPVLRMELHSLPDDSGLSLAMTFDGSKFQWRGQTWDFMQAAAKIPVGRENVRIDIDHIRIGHGGRKTEIAAAFDPASRVIRISKLDSGIDVLALARAMMPDAVGSLTAASTTGAWRISGEGEVPVDHPENFRWTGSAALDGDLTLASGETNVALQKPTFSVRVENQTVSISDFKAGLWEGSLNAPKLQFQPSAKEKKLRFETEFTLDGARSQSIVKSLGGAGSRPAVIPLDWTGAWRISGTGEIPVDQPKNFRWNAEVTLDGDVVYASGETNIAFQKPTFSLRAEEQVLSISDLKAGLWEGRLDVQKLQVHLPSKEKTLRIETQLTLDGARSQSILNSFGDARKESVPLDWKGAWRINGAAEIPVDQPGNFRWDGDVTLDGDLVYASGQTNVALQKPAFAVRAEERVVTISDFKAGLWEGRLDVPKLQVRLPSKEKNLQFETQFTLDGARSHLVLNSFGGPRNQPAPLDWTGAWRVSGTGEIAAGQPENSRWNGEVALDGDLVYASGPMNIALQKPAFSLRAEDEVMTISDFKAGLWEGSLKAPKVKVHLLPKEKKVRFETQLTLDGARPSAVRKSFSAGQKQPRVSRLKWTGTWQINGRGEVPMDHPEDFRWDGDVALGGDLGYASGETNVALQKPTFSLRLEEELVSISNFKAGLWEGSLSVPKTLFHLPSAKKKPKFETQITINDARLQSIINSFGGAQAQPGVVQCDWKGGGGFDVASLAGSGALSIAQAEFCRMPIVGPLHLIFDKLTPKFRKDEPSTMTVNHRLAGGILHLDEMKLVSEQARIEADGTIDLAREYARIMARGRLRKIQGLATRLITSLLTFDGRGPVDDIRWSLKNLPGIHVFGKSATKTVSAQTEAEKKSGRAVKGLIRLPGKVLRDE